MVRSTGKNFRISDTRGSGRPDRPRGGETTAGGRAEKRVRAAEPEPPAGVVVPPPDEIETLDQLARVGNMRSLRARADYLQNLDPRYAAFAGQLWSLTESSRSKAILALVARYRAAHNAVRTTDPQQ